MANPLSAEKYIQTRARTLPIYRCRVNINWETSGTANVIVIRRHTNGNFTYAAYLVDLLCLGVKDTYYNFNRFPDELENLLDDSESETEMMDIEYVLAHNIIYAGHDFATDYHIPQHPDFISTTSYLLEEDDEKIALVDVHTGDENGLPHLMVTSSNRQPAALARLKEYAGEGHYRYTVLQGEPFMEKDFDDDWEDVETDDDFDEEGLEDEDEEDPDFIFWNKEEWTAQDG